MPVSEVLDLSWAFQSFDGRPPLMVSYKDYQNQLEQFNGKQVNHALCLDRREEENQSPHCEHDGAAMAEDILDTEQLTNIGIYYYWWRTSIKSLHDMMKAGPVPDNADRRTLFLHPQHMRTVQKILQSANITNNEFSVVHWRGEKEGMDLMECAKAVIDTRRTIEEMDTARIRGGHPFVLMTSLNEDSGESCYLFFFKHL